MDQIKKEFQIFENYKKENNVELIYLDSAASSLTPDTVINKMNEYYFNYRSNINRAVSKLATKSTLEFENSRQLLSEYLNCSEEEIIWTSGATASSNMLLDLIALYDEENPFLFENNEILTTILEHHSSLLPLQKLARNKKMELIFLELDSDLNLDISNLGNLISEKTKIASITLTSNVTGTFVDIKNIARKIKEINKDIFVICDMTAGFGHVEINFQNLRNYVDAAYFSFHKAFGPTGVGALWIRREISREMTPSILGGGIVAKVDRDMASFRSDIKVFEAGTPNIAGIIGAGEAVKFLRKIEGKSFSHSKNLVEYFLEKVEELNLRYINIFQIKTFAADPDKNSGIISFQVLLNEKEIHPHDVAEILSRYNISVRAGHHCAEPLMNYFGIPSGLTRISFHIYNTENDIDILLIGLLKIKSVFEK